MRLKYLLTKTIPYIATITMVAGLVGCSCGSDSEDVIETTAEQEFTSEQETSASDDNEASTKDSTDKSESGNSLSWIDKYKDKTTGNNQAGNNGTGEEETTKVAGNSGNTGSSSGSGAGNSNNSGSNNTGSGNSGSTGTGNAGSGSSTSGGSGGNGSGSAGNGSSGNNGTGNSGNSGNSGSNSTGNGGSSSNNNGSSSGNTGNTGNAGGSVEFMDYVWETTYEHSTKKIDSYTTKYIATEVQKCYELYSDGSKVLLDEYTEILNGVMTLTLKNEGDCTYVVYDLSLARDVMLRIMNAEQRSIYEKWNYNNIDDFAYYMRNSDGKKFNNKNAMLGDNAALALVKELGLNNSSVSREKRIFDLLMWFDKNVTYDGTVPGQTTYECLVEKRCVCGGYANAIVDILKYTDIPVQYVSSDEINHAWNIVQLSDGNWYHIDGIDGSSDFNFNGVFSHTFDFSYEDVGTLDYNEPTMRLIIDPMCNFQYTGNITFAKTETIGLKVKYYMGDPAYKYFDHAIYIKGSDLKY